MGWIIFLAIAIWVIRGMMQVARKLKEQGPLPPRPAQFDPGEGERTRRIQEEIRRKILERRGGAAPAAGPLPAVPPVLESAAPPPLVEEPRSEARPTERELNAGELERQQQLADQLHELEVARKMSRRRAEEISTAVAAEREPAMAAAALPGSILADLRHPPTVRRAILLREILDRPVALR